MQPIYELHLYYPVLFFRQPATQEQVACKRLE